ncbi:hypothetical protein BOSEA31B_11210 [Hyphomicrobiales bacterium]|nr:hypothetical protein BOSEA31B_11210 [Hyphomicrobiales bacterium]CAH1697002.1 hypothetical protein BOSEA1005_10039 [Hyphomicrobiales bacterium]CAI0344940.1 hypothetical protein BO1005MUT1_350307 [Hyphomicrobiales bacterium]
MQRGKTVSLWSQPCARFVVLMGKRDVIPDKPQSGGDPETIIGRRVLRWIPGQARDDALEMPRRTGTA